MNGTRCRVWRATTPPHSLNTALHRYTPHGQVHIHMLTLGALASARTRSLQTSHTRSTLPTSHSFPLVITTPIMSCVPNAQHPPWPWRFPREIHAAPPDTRAAHFTEAARRRQARASVSLARRDNPAMAARSLVMAFFAPLVIGTTITPRARAPTVVPLTQASRGNILTHARNIPDAGGAPWARGEASRPERRVRQHMTSDRHGHGRGHALRRDAGNTPAPRRWQHTRFTHQHTHQHHNEIARQARHTSRALLYTRCPGPVATLDPQLSLQQKTRHVVRSRLLTSFA
mmetsp:Transcript_21176/g.64495  ORF Transcript_21176/g.64495 Transcript_21176/m.64495 type:complete len:287 (+) Transcript_21176:41-901(+)